MLRNLAIVAALAAASVSAPALAQSSGGLTITFGSGGYNNYDYDDDYYDDRGDYGYRSHIDRRYSYDNRYQSRAYQRELRLYRYRLAQWRKQEQRRRYWEQQRRDNYDWRYDRDD